MCIGTVDVCAPVFVEVILIVEAAFADAEAANLSKLRRRAGYGEGGGIVSGVRSHRVLLQFRDSVLAIGGLFLKMGNIRIGPMHQASCPRTAGLQAGTAMEDDHDVAAQGFG